MTSLDDHRMRACIGMAFGMGMGACASRAIAQGPLPEEGIAVHLKEPIDLPITHRASRKKHHVEGIR
jgi:hypothetical protein